MLVAVRHERLLLRTEARARQGPPADEMRRRMPRRGAAAGGGKRRLPDDTLSEVPDDDCGRNRRRENADERYANYGLRTPAGREDGGEHDRLDSHQRERDATQR